MKSRRTINRCRHRSLMLEPLESRVVLDGNVHAFMRGGTLHVEGDSAANQITIEQSSMHSLTISSRDGSTTINGQADARTFGGIRHDVHISMGSGDDVVEITGTADDAVTISDRLFIDTGAGADQVLLTEVHAIGLHVHTGSGDDTINVGNDAAEGGLVVTKEAVILTGSGHDDARIANSLFKRSLTLDMGGNNDQATIQATRFRKTSLAIGGSGSDTLNRQGNHGKLKVISFEHVNNTVQSPAPLPPIAANDTATVTRGGNTTINVAANDTSATSTIDPTSIAITQQPTSGTVAVNNNGTVTYTNNGAAAATDSFQYTIKDEDGTTSNAATVAITVNAPAALAAAPDAATIVEDATPNTATGNVLANDTGGTGAKTVSLVNGNAANVGADVVGAHGTFHINADGTFTYTLNNADAAVNALTTGGTPLTDAITYTASAGGATSDATLTVTIQGHTDTTFNAVDDTTGSVTEDSSTNTFGVNVLTNDTNAAGATTVTAVNGVAANVGQTIPGQHGTFQINSNGTLTYTLNNGDAAVNALATGQTLTDAMPYTATDGTTTSSATVRITIQGNTDTAFNAVDDTTASVTEDATPNTATGNVLTNDTNAAAATQVTAVNGVAGNVGTNVNGQFGTFNIAQNGDFTYTLDNTNATVNGLATGSTLSDSVTYSANDGTTTSTATLRVTIQGHTDGT
jgi:VCBS repeat-containing protein